MSTDMKETSQEDSTTPRISFSDFDLIDPLKETLETIGYEAPSPIQAASIPHLLNGDRARGDTIINETAGASNNWRSCCGRLDETARDSADHWHTCGRSRGPSGAVADPERQRNQRNSSQSNAGWHGCEKAESAASGGTSR